MRGFIIGVLIVGVFAVVGWFAYNASRVAQSQTPHSVSSLAVEAREELSDLYYDFKYSRFLKDLKEKWREVRERFSPAKEGNDLKQVTPESFQKTFNEQ